MPHVHSPQALPGVQALLPFRVGVQHASQAGLTSVGFLTTRATWKAPVTLKGPRADKERIVEARGHLAGSEEQ